MAKRRVVAYKELAQVLRSDILQGKYPAGDALPTEAELGQQYRVSRQTVRRAFQELVAEGMVSRVPGRGTFANSTSRQFLRQLGSIEQLMAIALDSDVQVTRALSSGVNVEAAGRLRLDSDVVSSLRLLRLHEGVVFCVTDVFFPPDIAALLTEVAELNTPGESTRLTFVGVLDPRLDSPIAWADQSLTAAAATDELAAVLGTVTGSPLLRSDRVYFDGTDRPVELAIAHFLPSVYSYRVRLQRNH